MSAYLFQNLYNVLAVRSAHPERRYVSWVKNDVNQFGLYLSRYLWIETGCLAQYARTSPSHEMSGTTIMARIMLSTNQGTTNPIYQSIIRAISSNQGYFTRQDSRTRLI